MKPLHERIEATADAMREAAVGRIRDLVYRHVAELRLTCRLDGDTCIKHGQIHGHEAEQLRKGIETLLDKGPFHECESGGVAIEETALRKLLDTVDACDSAAYLEAQATPDPWYSPVSHESKPGFEVYANREMNYYLLLEDGVVIAGSKSARQLRRILAALEKAKEVAP